MDHKLTNVHDALMRASDAKSKSTLAPYSFKLDPEHKDLAEQICKRHGTTLSEFLRQCVIGLNLDYLP